MNNAEEYMIMSRTGELITIPKETVVVPESYGGIITEYKVKILNSNFGVVAFEILDRYPTQSEIAFYLLKYNGRYLDVDKIYRNTVKPTYNYVYGKHDGCCKEFCWVNKTGNKYKPGDRVKVNTRFGVDEITVTKVEESYDLRKHKEILG